MNNFSCSIGKELAYTIDPVPNPLFVGGYKINRYKKAFHFNTIEAQGIRDTFAKITTAKSFGTDNISSYYLKLALQFIENSLALVFNTSTDRFPGSWKIARVSPIFIDGDKTTKPNYRLIYVLPVNAKLFEKLVTNQLYQHMNEKMATSYRHSGFLRLHSTSTCLLKIQIIGTMVSIFVSLWVLCLLTSRKHFIRWITKYFAKSLSFMVLSKVNFRGVNRTYRTVNSFKG